MNWRLAFVLILLAVPGCVAIAWLVLPLLVDQESLPLPLETLQFISAAQSIVLVTLAAFLGTWLSPKVGFRAPVISAAVQGNKIASSLRPPLLPGFCGGLSGAAIIVGFHAFAPSALAALQEKTALPLVARVLYGGITEEVLIRWGLMTLLVWVGWRMFARASAGPSTSLVWLAIALSAVLFGVAHVPAVAMTMESVPAAIAVYIIAGNTLFGIIAGYLFWRYGLEAAILAHALAHVFAYALRG
jgi:hypothetical protein